MWLHVGLPIVATVFLWWFSTGAILCLGRRPVRTFHGTMLALTALAALAFVGLYWTAWLPTVGGAYAGFVCGLALWGWHEASLLLGYVTGSSRAPCPDGARGFRRFRLALATILHHEIAILLTMVAVVVATWDAPNQIGTLTFAVLWVMRISAKLNVFLGAPNVAEEFLPGRLAYLGTYFRRDEITAIFPVSITLSTIALGLLIERTALSTDPCTIVGLTFVATLLALAILEHWFLVLPLPDTALWGWALPQPARDVAAGSLSTPSGPADRSAAPARAVTHPAEPSDPPRAALIALEVTQ